MENRQSYFVSRCLRLELRQERGRSFEFKQPFPKVILVGLIDFMLFLVKHLEPTNHIVVLSL